MFPLRLNSHYSLLRATLSPQGLCRRLRQLGYSGAALTDRDNLYGLWPFLAACREEGLTPVVGCQLSDPHGSGMVTCLVRNGAGYANLCRLVSARKGQADFELTAGLRRFGSGLLLLCREERLLTELHRHGLEVAADLGARPTRVGADLRRRARDCGVAAVATPESAVATAEDAGLFHLLRAIAGNLRISESARLPECMGLEPLQSPEVYAQRFAVWPEVITASEALAAGCAFRGPDFGLVMPPWSGSGPAAATLRRRAYRGAQKRYGLDLSEAVVERLEHELAIIEQMGFSSYFLVVRDIVHRPLENGRRRHRRICGRGSGAASLVAYCLEITNVCPLKYNLYFERFLNPGRSDPPDIDIDFAWDERDEVLGEVLADHRGHAALVCSHICFKPRLAIRETAKAYGIPGSEISRLTGRLSWLPRGDGDMYSRLGRLPSCRGSDLEGAWPTLIRLAERLVGTPRCISVHPGGVVITPRPIAAYVPVEQAPKGVEVIQWEKDGAEEAGLVKIDLLGNRSLGVIRDCLADIGGARGFAEERWEPEEDEATRATVARGRTMGCFYIESPAMRLLQKKAASGSYEQLVLQSSIIRPAANEYVREYVRRLHGGAWQPLHPELGDVLDETFGLMVYQEDVSRVAVRLAGFSHARADGLRKILSKKDRRRRLADYRREFFLGCRQKGLDEEEIETVWAMMMSFDGYSFCKPHSASYARVSFQAAYLKTHYPAAFMAAVISNQGGYYSTFAYVSEARRCGVAILPPDVNRSRTRWRSEGKAALRVGLQAVRDLSAGCIGRILSVRERGGPFRSGPDFFRRVRPAEDEGRQLINCGALDGLQGRPNRAELLWELAGFHRTLSSGTRMPLFDIRLPPPPPLPLPGERELLRREYRALGFCCRVHPILFFRRFAPGRVPANRLSTHVGKRVSFLGWLLSGKLVSTKTGEAMEFLTFEDECGTLEATFFPRVYRRYAAVLEAGKPYLLHGLVEADYGALTMTVEAVEPLEKQLRDKSFPTTTNEKGV